LSSRGTRDLHKWLDKPIIIAFFLIRIASLVGITKIVEVDCGDLSSVEMTILGNRILKAYASEWLKLNDEIVSLVK
jgi:hypothetical protein